jgi:hypothetical protein
MRRKFMVLIVLFFAAATMAIPLAAVAQVNYSGVAFREIGLPNGTLWAVYCNGQHYQTNESVISITLSPGTYNFSVSNISGYNASPQNGTVTAFLDPIKLTDITFSSTIPEFTSTQTGTVFLILTIIIVSIFTVRVKKR